MEDFLISGIQQVGVGTEDFRRTRDWIIGRFGADVRVLEDDTVAERMLPYTGGAPQKRHACININLQGGGGFEIWQFTDRKPQPCAFQPVPGDLGLFAAKVKCRDAAAARSVLSAGCTEVGPLETLPDGTPCFYVRDPYGNLYQLVERGDVFIERHQPTGGVVGVVAGVGDMDRALRFYGRILGYDRILSDTTGPFSTSGFIPGADRSCRRVLLGRTVPFSGAFAGLFGQSVVELVQGLEISPRKIYEGRFWGDPGFIQVCFDVTNMDAFKAHCAAEGHPFTVDSASGWETFDMGEASGRFCYVEDPDGTLIELVQTEKIPVVARLGWYLDMTKRDPRKPLPRFLFRMMGLVSKARPEKH